MTNYRKVGFDNLTPDFSTVNFSGLRVEVSDPNNSILLHSGIDLA